MGDIEKLKGLNDLKLIEAVKNYEQYGYSESLRNNAIAILESRGITVEELKATGNFENHEYREQ